MLIYLDNHLKEVTDHCYAEGRRVTRRALYAAIIEGAVERVRPKMMTVVAIIADLLPILWSHGTGWEIMRRGAVPKDRWHGILDYAHPNCDSGRLCPGQRLWARASAGDFSRSKKCR
jgi:hypothetical protein